MPRIKFHWSLLGSALLATALTALFVLSACTESGSGDTNPCGSCPAGASCAEGPDGALACQCLPGLTACNGACVDISSSGENCGACGNACGDAAPYCFESQCSDSCGDRMACGNDCPDLASDPMNCGACNNACGADTTCQNSACVSTVSSGGGTGGSGMIGTGGTGSGGTGTGGTGTGGTGTAVEGGGYITSGEWKGYAFTSAFGDATVMPGDFEDATDFPLCASGNVPGSTMGDNGAMIGWSINQGPGSEEMEDMPMPIDPQLDGITVSISNSSTAQLRLQIQGPDGATEADDRWCADIGVSGDDIFVPYDAFNTECWPGGDGTPYEGEPLTQVMVMVPAASMGATAFDFCIDGIAETTSDGSTGGTGCDLASGVPGSGLSGTLSLDGGQYQRVAVNTGTPQYKVQNNVFNPSGGDFTLAYDGATFDITTQTMSQSTGGAPVAFPSLIVGSSGGDGESTQGSNLPRAVSAITSIPTAWSWTAPSGGEWNAAYDVWFNTGGGADAGPESRTFLMVWFGRTGSIYAEGEGEGHSAGTFAIDGKNFNVYTSEQFEGRPIISYVPQSQIDSWSFDLNDFIEDAPGRSSSGGSGSDVIKDNYTLTNIFAGFEIWSESQGIKTTGFCAEVN